MVAWEEEDQAQVDTNHSRMGAVARDMEVPLIQVAEVAAMED